MFSRMLSKTAMWLFLLIIAVLILFPVIMAILGSMKSNQELNAGTSILPSNWQFDNYATTWVQAKFSSYVVNSLIYSLGGTVTTLIVVSLAAYAFARKEFPGKKLMLGIYTSMMFISLGALTLKPQFELMVSLHLHKSIIGMIIMMTGAGGSSFFIMYAFIKSITKDLDEAAMIDGASFAHIYRKIILPLTLPAIGIVGLFSFRSGWNSYLVPLVFTMSQPKLQPLTVGLVNLRYGVAGAMQSHLMLAGACISMIPMLIIYLLANKTFMQMNVGGLKG